MTPRERLQKLAEASNNKSWLSAWEVAACKDVGSSVLAVHLSCAGAAFCIRWDSRGPDLKSEYTTLDGAMAVYMAECAKAGSP